MATTCDQCNKRIRGAGHQTATRTLCDACNEQFMGLTAGYLAGGTVGDAISTSGWFQRIRGRKNPSP